ncbi:MAG: AAA family ATPase [Steroidobacteraceae bacterium]
MIHTNGYSPAYAEAALADEIGIIGGTPKGRGLRNAAINRGAFKVGGLVGAGALSECVAREALLSAACANGYLADHGERSTLDVIEHGLNAGIASPREGNGKIYTPRQSLHDAEMSAPLSRSVGSVPQRTSPNKYGKPKFCRWGDSGPPQRDDELRRHVYRRNGSPVRIKIKSGKGGQVSYVNWYRVRDGNTVGWQPKQPTGYDAVPYISAAINPFDPELTLDEVWWTEGEKDTDTLSGINVPSFTFGGCGDGVPEGIATYLTGRKIIIAADNDTAGHEHAFKKAAVAHAAGAAFVKIVEFSELPPKGDVADFLSAGGTAEQLFDRATAAPSWKPSNESVPSNLSVSSAPVNRSDGGDGCHLVMRCMADVQPEKIEWLWPGRIAVGKQTLIGGEPGLGKSQITAALAAAVTTGGAWPCDEGRAPLGSVLILSAEDDASDTIRPRLDAAGADVSGVHLISAVRQSDGNGRRTFNLQVDLALLEQAIKRIGNVRLVIIDPVSSYLGKPTVTRTLMCGGPLSRLATWPRDFGWRWSRSLISRRAPDSPRSIASSARSRLSQPRGRRSL